MKTIRIAFLLAVILACFLPGGAKTRRAVVIGLGKQQDKSWAKINGDKDVALVVGMLKSNRFNDISTLINEQATKAGIVKAFNSLIKRSQKGDIIYIHFSGHGQLMTDVDGDEEDGLDESWIPYDARMYYGPMDRGEKHLSDDEIGRYMSRLREKIGNSGVIAVVVDACHSGDSTRDPDGKEDVIIRGVDADFVIPGKRQMAGSRHAESWLTLSACRDFQMNQEYNGVGKLTHFLCDNWRSLVGKPDKDILKVIDRAFESRKYKGPYAQNPYLSGNYGNVFSQIFQAK
ncbi:MAG: caspase family protein [Muribaculaceae bacterium]|nr:caspase family protein [Muribaculaceae bacterium]